MDQDYYNWCLQRLDYLHSVVDPIVITSELVKESHPHRGRKEIHLPPQRPEGVMVPTINDSETKMSIREVS
ncbi:hypothetical protein FSP39_005946 [Pinctada imbricata]|uniref:Uncharacterized protein n=1 Tax=Pinctada imbricata TaxID=66713 RepID=A0AA89C7W4_PINIB|nr:hypothetical protein FSP39_005946 [Pinctada imbricata]